MERKKWRGHLRFLSSSEHSVKYLVARYAFILLFGVSGFIFDLNLEFSWATSWWFIVGGFLIGIAIIHMSSLRAMNIQPPAEKLSVSSVLLRPPYSTCTFAYALLTFSITSIFNAAITNQSQGIRLFILAFAIGMCIGIRTFYTFKV
jgi:hypothetical protein